MHYMGYQRSEKQHWEKKSTCDSLEIYLTYFPVLSLNSIYISKWIGWDSYFIQCCESSRLVPVIHCYLMQYLGFTNVHLHVDLVHLIPPQARSVHFDRYSLSFTHVDSSCSRLNLSLSMTEEVKPENTVLKCYRRAADMCTLNVVSIAASLQYV